MKKIQLLLLLCFFSLSAFAQSNFDKQFKTFQSKLNSCVIESSGKIVQWSASQDSSDPYKISITKTAATKSNANNASIETFTFRLSDLNSKNMAYEDNSLTKSHTITTKSTDDLLMIVKTQANKSGKSISGKTISLTNSFDISSYSVPALQKVSKLLISLIDLAVSTDQ